MNEDSEYCLRWHRHIKNFVESFENLLENEALADVYFFAEGQLVKAHKVVLSSCSTYFQSLFKETIERHPIIVLTDVKLAHIKALLHFMYRGTVNVPRESLEPILKMAKTLKIKGLADNDVKAEKVETEDSSTPMSLIHPKISNSHYGHPPLSISEPKGGGVRPPSLSHLYNPPSTSVHSVLSTALTMPSALSLTSPLSLPHLASLPPNLASSLASTLSNAIPQSIASFISPRDLRTPDEGESPMQKRRRKHRRRSGETIDSGDSDGRSSGSPGDSVSSLHLPRIPATITPIGLHRQHLQQQYHQNSSHLQQQPRDLSIHSNNHSSSHSSVSSQDRSAHNSPLRDRIPGLRPTPPTIMGFQHHPLIENHHQKPPQEEPENLESRRPLSNPPPLPLRSERLPVKSEPHHVSVDEPPCSRRSESPNQGNKTSPLTSGRRSDEERGFLPTRPSPKCGSSDPESLMSPSKAALGSQNRLDETSSDNNHYSDDEKEENSNGHREPPSERLSDSTPGPSTSRPQSEEAPHTPSFLGWPYTNETNPTEESFSALSGDSNQEYFRALNLVRAGFSGILPSRVTSDLYGNPSAVPLGIPLLLKGNRDKPNPKNLLGYPFPETPKQFTCDKCGRSYASTGNLKRHKKYECGVEPQFSCPICKKKFQHRHSVKIHVFSTHRNEAGEGGMDPTRDGPPIFSTPDGVPTVGTASWAIPQIPQDASSAGAQNQEG